MRAKFQLLTLSHKDAWAGEVARQNSTHLKGQGIALLVSAALLFKNPARNVARYHFLPFLTWNQAASL